MEYGLIFHGTCTVKYYCKNMKYRINIFMCLSWSKMRTQNYVAKHAHALGQFGAVKTDQWHPYYSFRLYARTALVWTKKKRSLRNEKLKANGASVC